MCRRLKRRSAFNIFSIPDYFLRNKGEHFKISLRNLQIEVLANLSTI